jgi:hypothetical protein
MYKDPELVDGIFEYSKKRVQGLKADYMECTLVIQLGHYRPGTPIDIITINYANGSMELANTFNGHRALGEFQLHLMTDDEVFQEEGVEEEVQAPFMDASLALAMVAEQSKKMGLPNLSDQFVNKKGERDPGIIKPSDKPGSSQ